MGEYEMKFTDNSKQFLNEKDKAITKALTAIGILAEKYAKEECPVDTGRLRNSISNETKDNTLYVGTNVEYAPKIELNDNITHTTGNAHFLRNSVTRHDEEYKKVVEQVLKG